ncbi:MAG: diacylglycerol kinase [Lautropia sp.]|nr:diacylglycerol kinase [Lautropia sp.]
MAKPGATGLTRIRHATGYSLQGLQAAWRGEAAFRQELLLVVVLTPLAFWVGQGVTQILLLLALSWQVMVVELLNSAVEAVVDRIGPEQHELSGRAKDLGSAAVLLSLLLAGLGWLALAGHNLLGWW